MVSKIIDDDILLIPDVGFLRLKNSLRDVGP